MILFLSEVGFVITYNGANYEIIFDVTCNGLIRGFCWVGRVRLYWSYSMRCEVVPSIQISILYAILLGGLYKNLQFIKVMVLFQETEDKIIP